MAYTPPATIAALAPVVQGVRVDRPATAIAAISTKSLFNVKGGNCIILGLLGEVTTIVQAQANNTKFVSTPTVGTAVDMCAVVDTTGHEVGGFLAITGVPATAATKANAGAAVMMYNPQIVAPGVIGLNTAADNTGAYKFSIWYVPADDGAYIEVA